MHQATDHQPGTVIISLILNPNCEVAYRSFPGALDLESFPSVSGVQSGWVDIARFCSAESLSHWLNSPKRSRLLKELKPLVDSWDVRQLNSNFAGWFPSQDSAPLSPPPAWKQALSVLLALYPVVMLINLYISPHLPAWPLPVNMLVSNILSICILNWLGMPLVNRWLDFWLQPSEPSPRLDWVGTVGIAAALLVMVVMFQQLS